MLDPGTIKHLRFEEVVRAALPVRWRHYVHVVQEREQLWFQPLIHRAERTVNAQTEEQRHQRFPLVRLLVRDGSGGARARRGVRTQIRTATTPVRRHVVQFGKETGSGYARSMRQ